MEYIHHYKSPIGNMRMVSDGKALTGLWFDKQKYIVNTWKEESEDIDLPIFQDTIRWLELYFQGEIPGFIPELKLEGTEFREAVWKILLTIPYGESMTYGEIAAIIAKQRGVSCMSAQAVGGAVGHNPVSIIVPCHRVLGADGSLTGYAGGLEKKIALLKIENIGVKEK